MLDDVLQRIQWPLQLTKLQVAKQPSKPSKHHSCVSSFAVELLTCTGPWEAQHARKWLAKHKQQQVGLVYPYSPENASQVRKTLMTTTLNGVQKAEVRRSEHCTSAPPLLPGALTGLWGLELATKTRPTTTTEAAGTDRARGQRAGVNGIRKPTRDQPDSRARQTASPRARSQ